MVKLKAKRFEILHRDKYILFNHCLFYLQIDLDGILELNPQLRSNIPSITMVAQNGTNIPTTSKLARVNIII